MRKVRIIENNPMVHRLLELFVEAMPEFKLGEPADVILLDACELQQITALKRKKPSVKIVVMTRLPEYSYPEIAWNMGADGFWYQVPDQKELEKLMLGVLAGNRPFPGQPPMVRLGDAESSELTRRELEVLRELSTGKTDADIAQTLNCSVPTVKHHIQQLMLKTGLENRTQLAIAALISGLVVINR